jgi:diguanylate cyclase (GGDEF)-like protein
MLGVFAAIRCGWSRRLADPAMTLPQMLYAVACASFGYAIAGRAHAAVPLILAVILTFGMFGMSMAQLGFVGLYALLLFGGVMAGMARIDPAGYPPAAELSFFLFITIMVCGVLILGTRLRSMRERLRQQRGELLQAVERIRELATHDELTGLINRRHLRELLEQDRLRSMRAGHPWSVALIDLDHFKKVNDTHGHAVGDEVLRIVSRMGQAQARQGDVLARWGGEEFVMLLQDAEPDRAKVAVDRLREHLAAQALRIGETPLKVTLSAGVAAHRVGEAIDQTLARADSALYEAKARGRNCVVMAA